MAWLYRFSIRYPKAICLGAVLMIAAMAPGIARLKLRTDGHALVPTGAPEILLDREIRDEFNNEDPIVVLIRTEHADGIFNVETLTLVKELTTAFGKIEGVRPVDLFSLATEHGHRVKPGTLTARRFLEPLPRTAVELERLRSDLHRIRLYTGTLVSKNEQATPVLVGVPAGASRTELYNKIHEILNDLPTPTDSISVIGAPVAEALLGTHLLEDLGVPAAVLGQTTRADEVDELRMPQSLYELRLLIGRRIGLVPVALAIMALVFLISFRSLTAMMLPLAEVGACLLCVFGLMGYVDVPVYLTTAVLPLILTAVGIADEIHIFKRYADGLKSNGTQNHVATLLASMDEMWRPVTKTSITTAIGFLSFALSPIGPVRAFGIFTAVGVIFCLFWSLTVIPASLALCPPKWFARRSAGPSAAASTARQSFFERLALLVVRRRVVVVVVALLLGVSATWGVRRIVVQDSWIDGFAPDSEFYKATTFFNEQFLGTHMLLLRADLQGEVLTVDVPGGWVEHMEIYVPGDLVSDPESLIDRYVHIKYAGAPPPGSPIVKGKPVHRRWQAWIEEAERVDDRIVIRGARRKGSPRIALRVQKMNPPDVSVHISKQPLKTPDALHRIEALETFLEAHTDQAVGGVIGTADYLKTTNMMARGLKEERRVIPDKPEQIGWAWAQYLRIRGEDRRNQIVGPNYDRALISVFMKNANFVDTQRLMDDIRDYEREHLTPHGIKLDFAGDVAVSQTIIRAIVTTQTRSLLLSLVGIWLVTALMGRSLGWGLLCVLPCAFAVLIDFAVMGLIGMPLGVATSMFAGMTLGIGVDYAIHLLERYRLARRRGLETEPAIQDAVRATGPAILIDALAVALGFGMLTLSQVPANARLGALVVLSILACLAATLVLLPAILGFAGKRTSDAPRSAA